MKKIFPTLLTAILVISCNNDDDGLGGVSVPPRSLVEVAAENDEEIREFLQTHFYNYEDFDNPPVDFDFKVVIDTIAGENADKTPLIVQVESAIVNVSDSEFGLSQGEEDIPHTYYYAKVKEGDGPNPTIADSTLLRYEGLLLDGTKFDATPTYLWQELPFTIRGYGNGISNINSGTAEGLIINTDGTAQYTNSGVGIVIMPSGLGYFLGSGPGGNIPSYSPLIFTVEVGSIIENTDNDGDGIPSIMEDLNNNGNLFDDNTDSEDEANANFPLFANFRDADDDGDGIPTRDEIVIDAEGNITFPDSDGDKIPDYLDNDN